MENGNWDISYLSYNFVRGVHIMLFPQKRNTTAKGRKRVGIRQQTWHQWMVVNLSVINVSDESFLLIYCVQMNLLCKLYIEP